MDTWVRFVSLSKDKDQSYLRKMDAKLNWGRKGSLRKLAENTTSWCSIIDILLQDQGPQNLHPQELLGDSEAVVHGPFQRETDGQPSQGTPLQTPSGQIHFIGTKDRFIGAGSSSDPHLSASWRAGLMGHS